jgi:hypothetical protein
VTTLYWLRYGFLVVLLASTAWMVWLAFTETRDRRRR